MESYLLLFVVVFGVNLMPAFGPPTWTILVLYGLNSDLPVAPTVALGALAAASGRLALASLFRRLGERAPARMRRNLGAARRELRRRKGAMLAMLGLFALSPVPSAQLFEAAGLTRVPLLPFTLAFFSGRLVSYSIYAGTARSLAQAGLGKAFMDALTSPVGFVVQFAAILGVVALPLIDWRRRFGGRLPTPRRAKQAQ